MRKNILSVSTVGRTILILIILEVTLWESLFNFLIVLLMNLNPYYIGSYSMRNPIEKEDENVDIILILIILEVTLWVRPYFAN